METHKKEFKKICGWVECSDCFQSKRDKEIGSLAKAGDSCLGTQNCDFSTAFPGVWSILNLICVAFITKLHKLDFASCTVPFVEPHGSICLLRTHINRGMISDAGHVSVWL